MWIRARAPLRISFAGGGTDVAPYCDVRGGVVLSATINRHAYVTLVPGGNQITIQSLDYDASISYGIEDPIVYDGQLDLAKGVIDHFRRAEPFPTGLKIILHNDAPPGSGLGSSSALAVAMVKALATFLKLPLDSYQIAQKAFDIERLEVGIIGGKQDQYACAFGGFNFIEFHRDQSLVNQLRIPEEVMSELEYRLVFAYVGGKRVYSDIIQQQVDNFKEGNESAVEAMDTLKELAYQMKNALLVGNLSEFAQLLDQGWQNKKRMADGITNPSIDAIYTSAIKAGALGGKVTGAGGGGFMFFICDPFRTHEVQEALRAQNASLVDLSFTNHGVSAWNAPESRFTSLNNHAI
ncbi:MAG: GHMP kinase [Fimbriimonadaceae bacterium]|nr:GHMP kinase [Fimbriimonadaceae bacterium]